MFSLNTFLNCFIAEENALFAQSPFSFLKIIPVSFTVSNLSKKSLQAPIIERIQPIVSLEKSHSESVSTNLRLISRADSIQYRRTSSFELLKRYLEERAYDCT